MIRLPFSVKQDEIRYYLKKLESKERVLQSHKVNHERICRLIQLFKTYNYLLVNSVKNSKTLLKISTNILKFYQDEDGVDSLHKTLINIRNQKIERIRKNYRNSLFLKAKINRIISAEMNKNFYER